MSTKRFDKLGDATGFFLWLLFAIAILVYFFKFGRNSIKYGIDLVGGSYITLEVKEEEVLKNYLNDKIKPITDFCNNENIIINGKPIFKNKELVFRFNSHSDAKKAENKLVIDEKECRFKVEGEELFVTLSSNLLNKFVNEAVLANIDILSSRFSHLSEIHIGKQGLNQIVVELPDVKDHTAAKELIGKSASLEFKLVEDHAGSANELMEKYDYELPEGTIILPGKGRHSDEKEYYLVSEYTPVSGKYFKDARVGFADETRGKLGVIFKFNKEGGDRFYELTSQNINKPLAIVLDNEVIQAPIISQAIRYEGTISGNFTSEEAKNLSKMLKSGAFKAKVNFIEDRQIGPTLGTESIKKGLISCLIGFILLFIFSLLYYRLSGLFAFFALLYNLVLLMLILSLFKATLTLPGIAGVVLTIGMAIDASILIYERIKEAMRLNPAISITAAVADGFSDALYVILDSNITTFIVALILFYFGTGPIKGFAVTMMIGIISTLISGLFFLKSLFKAYLSYFEIKKLSI